LARIHLNQIDTEDKEMLERITKEFREQMSQAKIAAENDFKATLHVSLSLLNPHLSYCNAYGCV